MGLVGEEFRENVFKTRHYGFMDGDGGGEVQ